MSTPGKKGMDRCAQHSSASQPSRPSAGCSHMTHEAKGPSGRYSFSIGRAGLSDGYSSLNQEPGPASLCPGKGLPVRRQTLCQYGRCSTEDPQNSCLRGHLNSHQPPLQVSSREGQAHDQTCSGPRSEVSQKGGESVLTNSPKPLVTPPARV